MKTNLETKQELALEQGEAYQKAVDFMEQMDVHARAVTDDYIITFAAEEAEGLYLVQPEGDLQWEIPTDKQNHHFEIAVQDKEDLRFVPQLDVKIMAYTTEGEEVIVKDLPFLWHPFLYHYGVNVIIPEEGEYEIKVAIDKALFGRHDEDKGNRYGDKVVVSLGVVNLKPGRKEYGPE